MFIRRTENNWLAKWWLGVDKTVLFSVLALIVFGILIQFSASPYQAKRIGYNEYHFIKNIFVYACIGIACMICISAVKLETIRKGTVLIFPMIYFMLMITLLFASTKGGKRWINLKVIKIQPSEFLKPLFAITVAMILVRIKDLHKKVKNFEKKSGMYEKRKVFLPLRAILLTINSIHKFFNFFKRKKINNGPIDEYTKTKEKRNNYCILLAGILGFIIAVLLAQPDVGMTITYVIIFLSEVFVAGISKKLILALFGLVLGLLVFAYKFLPHFFIRINKFLMNDNYQLDKALDAIKESNFLIGGHANNLKTIVPDIHTDFIFAAVIEEFGPILAILLLIVFLVLIVHILYRLKIKDNLFVIFSGVGIISYLIFQICVNITSTLGFMPTKGMTLPFISYGGSSFISSCIAIGLVLSLLQDQNLRR